VDAAGSAINNHFENAINMIQRFLQTALFAGAVVLLASPCSALTLLLVNGERLRGYPVSEVKPGSVVVIAVPQRDGGSIKRSVPPGEIRRIVKTVDYERLENLDGSNAKAYYNYAEELAERRFDPEARDTAIRLFLIAASLNKADYGRAAFLGLIPLARNASEEKRFRAMAYLHDPAHDEATLSETAAPVAAPVEGDRTTRDLLRAMQLLRQAKRREAGMLLHRDDVAKAFAEFSSVFPEATLEKFLTRSNEILPFELEMILRVELALEGVDAGPSTARSPGAGWGKLIASKGDVPVTPLQMTTLARRLDPQAKPGAFIDPGRTLYRSGKWTTP